ncbi:hypothetical protein GCK72_016049 [Caenorhabditis remanei]|uniref:Uncharacterized protein n=1 Tax=Caenorhabditis remanei TaxID=31234 RepID=A0A6A5GZ57_CAERE|nr:hypothetical protein GCK72_016049 [Caenorhabditis remanei]KAF1759582.1 hypothetical protein GCK72_016049 [Caenorhabditis remanei]
MPNDFKLSYESVILNSEDIGILERNEWFNDKLLTFIGEYLMNSHGNSGESRGIHVFTPPETEMIRHSSSDDEVDMYFGMLGVGGMEMVGS